jgi:hypothetical protein
LFVERGRMRDIIAAALTMHVIGLSVPIFFQLLVDKVVPNQAFSTLYALSAGVGVLILFDAGFNYLRNYLLSFITRRLDRQVANNTIEHLLKLPIDYFHANPVGGYSLQAAGGERRSRFPGQPAVQHVSRFPGGHYLPAGSASLLVAADADRAGRRGRDLRHPRGNVALLPRKARRGQRDRGAPQGLSVRDPQRNCDDQNPDFGAALAAALAPLHRRDGDKDPVLDHTTAGARSVVAPAASSPASNAA